MTIVHMFQLHERGHQQVLVVQAINLHIHEGRTVAHSRESALHMIKSVEPAAIA